MKTTIQTFCQQFSNELDPFAANLAQYLQRLSSQADATGLNDTVLSLREVEHRLSTLQEKIAEQQAYLLIFGPLKSGKSTLMNAISGTYVSEVSSLPAYPALVYVKNGDQQRFQATTYEGEKREFKDNLQMAQAVNEDHARLASKILEVEELNEDFNPKEHYPQAIRKMEVITPAPDLAESGSVLVDTPGLYSRMKFGYDQMTKDFRNAAACAIFVVKTDNLFFEKVFEEFEELLGYFSRIFLVSNIDTSKKDLKPDGSLEESLESRDPDKVIDAFRSLSMSAPLRAAIDDGRLNIYSIDLLKAASKRLQKSSGTATDDGEGMADQQDAEKDNDGFQRFLDDLTGYLNSSDYLNDFMVDSMRVATDLAHEAQQSVGGDAVNELETRISELKEKLNKDREKLRAVNDLKSLDDHAFDHLTETRESFFIDLTTGESDSLHQKLQEEVTQWLNSDESWNDLIEKRLNRLLVKKADQDKAVLGEKLMSLLQTPTSGAQLPPDQQAAYTRSRLDLSGQAKPVLQKIMEQSDSSAPAVTIQAKDIPLKRNFSDVMLLRSQKQIQTQFFGPEGDQPISSENKQKRLAGSGEQALRDRVSDIIAVHLPEQNRAYLDTLIESYIKEFKVAYNDYMEQQSSELNQSIKEGESALAACATAKQVMEEMQSLLNTFDEAISDIHEELHIGVDESELDESETTGLRIVS